MKFSDLPLNPTPRVLRQFAVAWLILFSALALNQILVRHRPGVGSALAWISWIGLLGLIWPNLIRPLFRLATIAAFPIGWTVTQATLAIMFYLVLSPIGFWLRRRGRDELQLKLRPDAKTFWIERPEPPAAESYLKQY